MGNLGSTFPGNVKVSQEILIVHPAHLSQKCDTHRMNAREGTNPLKGRTPYVTVLVIGGKVPVT